MDRRQPQDIHRSSQIPYAVEHESNVQEISGCQEPDLAANYRSHENPRESPKGQHGVRILLKHSSEVKEEVGSDIARALRQVVSIPKVEYMRLD